ncbi:peptide-methionine (R)-S-oxide reductase [Aspergillus chevalieri]|uniref:Peptide-methionine (R)-S-oxide reductase n=1 Tax=Aspergillus chevalieri TaxID=182096 RepID=A0A7R7VXR7_ASPCH|nr:uncharacterized protein ACHE_80565S [Aspergillus chevalieri]BCR92665.1 hypothetical protein ACHE_80565S [Aspergillus chevalieri]
MRFQRLTAALRTFSIPLRSQTTASPSHYFGKLPLPVSGATVLKAAPTVPFIGSLFSSSARAESSDNMSYPDQRSDDEWRAVLSPEQFRILREKGTERPYTGAYDAHYPSNGVYTCAGCDAPLYKANHKFKSGCGWPAYFDSVPGAVKRFTDSSFGMERTEIVCSNCGGHLGHVFKGEGYPTPTDERHCVNSVSLRFTEGDEKAKA